MTQESKKQARDRRLMMTAIVGMASSSWHAPSDQHQPPTHRKHASPAKKRKRKLRQLSKRRNR